MVSNPARQVGWVSIDGNKLNFDDLGFAFCPATDGKYKLGDRMGKLISIY